MLRSTVGKAMAVGRFASALLGLALVVALVVGLTAGAASVALGANGDSLVLGRANNAATSITALVSDVANPGQAALQVRNSGEGPALELRVGAPGSSPADKTVAPMRVNSQVKVANLNADTLDGQDSGGFYAAGSKVADSAHADQADTATTADSATNAVDAQNADNADTLDGKDSTEFLGINGKAQDAFSADFADSASRSPGRAGRRQRRRGGRQEREPDRGERPGAGHGYQRLQLEFPQVRDGDLPGGEGARGHRLRHPRRQGGVCCGRRDFCRGR